MASDPGNRRLLPHNPQLQTYNFAPPNLGPRENQKNYVFVDEHNRHKRLKVMRACEGCRRRKIKCDAATTNTWPCSACVRLKLQCVPPTVNYEREFSQDRQGIESERLQEFETSSGSGEEDYHSRSSIQQHLSGESGSDHGQPTQVSYNDAVYQSSPYGEHSGHAHSLPYNEVHIPQIGAAQIPYGSEAVFPTPPGQGIAAQEGAKLWHQDQYSGTSISDALGELKIDDTGIAPYISHQKKSLAEAPALEEFEINLPPMATGPDLTVRIPPELMPSEQQASQYFDTFFANIHPYVPVINRSYFYQQWHTNRESISPLILEGIFACAGRMSGDPSQGARWLALAGKHADCFMDVPRLSTIQAMLLILKARESAPKRGYYYRSWMTIVNIIAMAKDLGLHEHHALHQSGKVCDSAYNDCVTKTRVWQTVFACEVMIGGPQGRFDMSCNPETVDTSVPGATTGFDTSDIHVSRQFTYLVRVVKNVRQLIEAYVKVKQKKDWAMDPHFVQLNPSFSAWLNDLPPDLQVAYPMDGSPPWIPSHFVGNLHSYYHLSILFCYRPQLAISDSFAVDGRWKQYMVICYSSAKSLCKLQEAILQNFGLPGLLCMQRGINFTIYAILTATMLHLVALTSPDPELNADAKDYFTRHMRILEQCASSWPMPEMQAQIDALREAFSADLRKPFELKLSFPYGSPPAPLHPSPIHEINYRPQNSSRQPSMEHPGLINYNTQPLTPPISAGDNDLKGDSPAVQSLVMMAGGQRQKQPMQQALPMADSAAWNPTKIFDQWATAFGTPPVQPTPQTSPPPLRVSPTAGNHHHDLPHLHDTLHQNYTHSPSMMNTPQSQPLPTVSYTSAGPAFVSPSMWRESVASVYTDGLKRRWDYDGNDMMPQVSKRTR
ncbi:MAG: hypothetical protein M1827_004695 [Pycnora praestabilis]|nr:MAG: hypothetical protein M1827_004695 [Pycnora praestabilis]